MYPFRRFVWHILRGLRAPKLPFDGTHENDVICWPWDLDPWNELNNGRTLTLYDLGRFALGARIGLGQVVLREGWRLTVAGSSVRYRRRVQIFARLKMRTRLTCWDDRFFYMEQSMWKSDGECASHLLLRAAVVGDNGIVPTADVIRALGGEADAPDIPEWIAAWAAAENMRPWPPMSEDT